MPKRKQSWEIGDVFTIPTEDGKFALAQIIGHERPVLNSVAVALFDERVECMADVPSDLPAARAFSVQFVTRDLLDSGVWKVIGRRPVLLSGPHEDKRHDGFIGAKVIGSGIIAKFVNAYFGLHPWDEWLDPEYLDKLLVSPDRKPKNLRKKDD